MKYSFAILLVLASFNAFAGGPYKWVDAQGKLHITDTPPPPNAKVEKLHAPSASQGIPATSAPAAAPTIYEQAAELNKEKQAREEAAKKAAQEKEQADARKQNCEAARSQLLTLQNSPRISVYDDKGERTLLDDAARQQKMTEAQDAVGKFCN